MAVRSCMFLLLLIGLEVTNAKYFKFEDCSVGDKIADVLEFDIPEDPVRMKKQNMTIKASVTMKQDISSDAVLKTRYYKVKDVFGVKFDIPIPCLLGKFGSCTLSLCEYLEMFKEQAEVFFPPDKEYGCPVTKGDYGGGNTEVVIPYIPTFARMIIGGKYRTELKLLDKRGGKELAYYKIWVELRD